MTTRLDPQYAAQLMTAAVAATGARPRNDKGRWMKDVLANAANIHQTITPWGEGPSLLERAVSVQRFRGVLLSVEPAEQGHRLEVTFLPLNGKYAGKWINPRAKVPASGPTPHDHYEQGFDPAVETWAGPWIRDGRGQHEWDDLRRNLGKAFVYTAHREKEGEEGAPKGGYRVFDELVEPCQVPEELQAHVDRILKAWKIVAQANEQAAAPERVTTSRRDDGATEYRVPTGHQPDPEPEYTDEDMAPFEPEGPSTPRQALAVEVLEAQSWIKEGQDGDGPVDRAALDSLRAALKVIGRDAAPLAGWVRQYGITDYSRPKTWDQYAIVVDGVARIHEGRELP